MMDVTCASKKQMLTRYVAQCFDEQSDARERRSRAELQWTINRRRPVIGDVLLLGVSRPHDESNLRVDA